MFEHLSRQLVQAGECIFKEGELGDTAYIIEEGCVEVCIGEGENKIRLSLLGKDNLIGEIALIDHQPRTATVRAVVHTVLVPIQRNMVDELLEKTDPVIQHLLHVVLERFRHKHGQYEEGKQVEQYDPQRYNADIIIRQRAVANLSLAEDMRFALQAEQFEL
ncbi:MAG TPA: cyclic nucleotide-binding domain-containing protein, partial [Methyloradius sp.]